MASSSRSRIDRMLAGATKAAIAEVQPALLKVGDRVADTMRQLAPEDTGNLIESISVTPAGKRTPPYSQPGGETLVPENQVMITAGDSDARYPHLVEYGTTKAKAQPFFWPAYRLEKKKAAAAIKRAIGTAVRKGAKSGTST